MSLKVSLPKIYSPLVNLADILNSILFPSIASNAEHTVSLLKDASICTLPSALTKTSYFSDAKSISSIFAGIARST